MNDFKEDQMILRLPRHLAEGLRRRLEDGGEIHDINYKIEADGRTAMFYLGDKELNASVVDLPCIVEAHKTVDRRTFFKCGDIAQALLVREKDENPPKNYILNSGITPPTKDIRTKRYKYIKRRKTMEASITKEEEVKMLLREAAGMSSSVEIISEEDAKRLEGEAAPVVAEDDHEVGPCNLLLKIRMPSKVDLGRSWFIERMGKVYKAPPPAAPPPRVFSSATKAPAMKAPSTSAMKAPSTAALPAPDKSDSDSGSEYSSSAEDIGPDEAPDMVASAAENQQAELATDIDALFDDAFFDGEEAEPVTGGFGAFASSPDVLERQGVLQRELEVLRKQADEKRAQAASAPNIILKSRVESALGFILREIQEKEAELGSLV